MYLILSKEKKMSAFFGMAMMCMCMMMRKICHA